MRNERGGGPSTRAGTRWGPRRRLKPQNHETRSGDTRRSHTRSIIQRDRTCNSPPRCPPG